MFKRTFIYSYSEASQVAQNFYAAFIFLYNQSQEPDVKDIQVLIDESNRLLEETNIGDYMYPNSLIWKAQIFATNDLNNRKATVDFSEDVHYMGEKDTLAVMSADYYGSLDFITEIMSRNRIYSTDDALRKGILKVLSRDAN